MKKSSLLIKEPPLVILPSLAQAIGLNEAIIVQQLHYWLENPKAGVMREGEKWIFNTYEDWMENFPFWSVPTIKRIFLDLEKAGIVISAQLDANKHDQTKFYRLDYDVLNTIERINLIPSSVSNQSDDNRNTETTTETTKEKIIGAKNAPELTIENQIYTGVQKVVKPTIDDFESLRDLAAMQIIKFGADLEPLAIAAIDALKIIPSKRDVKGWALVLREMKQAGVIPENIKAAASKLLDGGMTIADPFGLKKTAIALAAKKKQPTTEYNYVY